MNKSNYTEGTYYNLLHDTGIQVDFSYQYTRGSDWIRIIIAFDNYMMPSLTSKFIRPPLENVYVEVEGGQTRFYGECLYVLAVKAVKDYEYVRNFSRVFTGN